MTPPEIKALRESMGLNQLEFCKLLGLTGPAVSRFEAGSRRPNGSALVLLKMLAAKQEAKAAASIARQEIKAPADPVTLDAPAAAPVA